jgi:hypothetical protein
MRPAAQNHSMFDFETRRGTQNSCKAESEPAELTKADLRTESLCVTPTSNEEAESVAQYDDRHCPSS